MSLAAAVSLGFDSLVAAFGIAPYIRRRRARSGLAAWFGLCDAAGTLIGGASGPALWAVLPAAAPYVLLTVGLLLTIALVVTAWRATLPTRRVLAVGLPVLLALDNVVAAPPLAGRPLEGWLVLGDAATAGLASAVLALVGLWFGEIAAAGTAKAAPKLAPCSLPLLMALILAAS